MMTHKITNSTESKELAPVLSDDAALLLRRLLLTLAMALLFVAARLMLTARTDLKNAGVAIAVMLVVGLSYLQLKRGHVNAGLIILCWELWLVVVVGSFFVNGVRTPVIFVIPVLLMTTVWVQGLLQAWWMTGLTIVNFIALTLAEYQGWLPVPVQRTSVDFLIVFSIVTILGAAVAVTFAAILQRQLAKE